MPKLRRGQRRDVLTRTYTAALHPRGNSALLEHQSTVVLSATRRLLHLLTQAVADQTSTSQWVEAWCTATSRAERIRLASIIVGSWVGTEISPPLSIALPGGVRQAEDVVATQLASLGLDDAAIEQFLADQALTKAPTDDVDATWVSYLPTQPIPTLGWESLNDRLTGHPHRTTNGALNIPCANTLSRGMGQGSKTDPAPIIARASTLLNALEDRTLTTVGDLGQAVLPSQEPAPDGVDIEHWLAQGLAGRAPAPVLLLRNRPATFSLDSPVADTTTLRQALTTKTREWSRTWQKRAAEATQVTASEDLAGTWLGKAITDTTGLPYSSGPYTDLLITAATPLARHRAHLRDAAIQWSQATTALKEATAKADRRTLAALDDFTATNTHQDTPYGPAINHQAHQGLDALLTTWATQAPHHRAPAASLGVTWQEWATWLADHSHLWDTDNGAALTAALTVHDARRRLVGIPIPALQRPTQSHPGGPTYARGRWRGTINPDGTINLHLPDPTNPTGYTAATLGWSSRRITKTISLAPASPRLSQQAVTRLDTTSLLAADTGTRHPVPTAELAGASFTIIPTGRATWRLHIHVPHTPPGTNPTGPTTSMGVTLNSGLNATWTTWSTLPDHTAPADHATLPKNPDDGVPRTATRINPPGRQPQFAHPVHEGTIRIGNPKGARATTSHKQAAAHITRALRGLRVPPPPTSSKIHRTTLATWATDTITAALTAQKNLTLAAQAAANEIHQHLDVLNHQWPLTAEEMQQPLTTTWGARQAAINKAIAIKGRHLLPGAGQGLCLTRIIELDDHLKLMRKAATAPTPHSERSKRALPKNLGATMTARRNRLRRAWAQEMASQIVKKALLEGATHIAMPPEDTTPANEQDITACANADVLRHIRSLAPLHGLTLVTPTPPATATHPITNAPLTTPLITTTAAHAAHIHHTPTWRRLVAHATTRPGSYPLIEQAARVLQALADERQAADDKDAWDKQARTVAVHLPHPRGTHLAEPDAVYAATEPTLSLGAVFDAAGLHLTGIQDRSQVLAAHMAKSALA